MRQTGSPKNYCPSWNFKECLKMLTLGELSEEYMETLWTIFETSTEGYNLFKRKRSIMTFMTWQVQDVLGIFDESRRSGGPGEKEVNYIQAEELVYRMDLLWKTALVYEWKWMTFMVTGAWRVRGKVLPAQLAIPPWISALIRGCWWQGCWWQCFWKTRVADF